MVLRRLARNGRRSRQASVATCNERQNWSARRLCTKMPSNERRQAADLRAAKWRPAAGCHSAAGPADTTLAGSSTRVLNVSRIYTRRSAGARARALPLFAVSKMRRILRPSMSAACEEQANLATALPIFSRSPEFVSLQSEVRATLGNTKSRRRNGRHTWRKANARRGAAALVAHLLVCSALASSRISRQCRQRCKSSAGGGQQAD